MYLDNKEKYNIVDISIFVYNGEYILATVVDAKLLMNDDKYEGIKQINYYATKTHFDGGGFKTNATIKDIMSILNKLN